MDGLLFNYNREFTPTRNYAMDPLLEKLAADAVQTQLEKIAIVPAGAGSPPPPGDPSAMGGAPPMGGGAPPMDPSMGGAPPADPSMGGGGLDPNMLQQIAQALAPMMQGGGAGGAGKAGGGKKAEDAIRDAKIYAMDVKLSLICEHLGIQLPASVTLGNPPDPMSQQAAQQEHQNASSMVASDPASSAGGGVQPVAPMDPSAGPPAPGGMKQGSFMGEIYPSGYAAEPTGSSTEDFAARMREILRG